MFRKIKSFLFENQTTRQTVAKNTFWLAVTNVGGRVIKAAVIIYAARVLGTANYGIFSYAITLAGFITLFMDPGVNGILMRDASRANEEDRRAIFDTTFAIKIFLLAIGVAIVIFIAPFFSTLPGAKALLPIVAIILALDTLRDFFSALMRAKEKMEQETIVAILTNSGITAFGFLFLYRATTAQSLGWGYVLGDCIGVVTAIIILRHNFKKIFFYFSRERIVPIMRAAWPFAAGSAFGFLFTNTDILIISWMRSASDVGIYAAAIRIVQVLYMIPGILQLSMLPLFSRLAKRDDPKFRTVLEQALRMIFFASVPLSFGGIILGKPIISFVFGVPYASGGLALQILMVTILFDFTATIIVNALFAYDHQRSMVVSAALGAAVNVALDLLLIPRFGITGSAVATLAAQFTNNWYLWRAMKKVNYFEIVPHLGKIVAAGAIMAVATILLSLLGVHLLLNILISGIIYFLVLRILREHLLLEVKHLLFPSPAAMPAENNPV